MYQLCHYYNIKCAGKHWAALPGEAVKSLSSEVLMTPQDKALSDLAWIKLWPCFELEIEQWPSWGPLQPQWCSLCEPGLDAVPCPSFPASPYAGDKD